MEELKEKLAAIGIEEDKIDSVIETFTGFISDKLPEGAQDMVQSLLNGEAPDTDGLLDKAKGLFGG